MPTLLKTTENENRTAEGLIFNIQKFSINDGRGIRTVVFFKGCPLRCPWCANPESQKACIEKMRDDADGVLKTVGEYKTVPEVMKILLQDRDFYEESQGGVTFSGGEVLNQPGFAIALAKAIKKEGIDLACETTGFAKPQIFERFMNYMDFIFFDVKHWDSEKHREATGVPNSLILHNLQTALEERKEVLVRIPVIPDFNNSADDAVQFGKLFNRIGVEKVEILPFHQFGLKKYAAMGRNYAMKDIAQLHPEDLLDYKHILNRAGIAVKLDGSF